MPLTTGKMNKDHERKIKKNIVALKKDMDAKDLIDWFIQEEIFDFEDHERITGYNPNTAANRNNEFFKLLFNSGPQAYSVFLKALEKNGQSHLTRLVENTVLSGGADGDLNDDASWITSIPQQTRTRRMDERDLSKLAQTLANDWEMVMYDLGLSKTDVEHAKMEQATATMQIYTCLHKWKVRVVNGATLEKFVKVVQDCPSVTVNWALMQRIAQQM